LNDDDEKEELVGSRESLSIMKGTNGHGGRQFSE
jgi:hypothetical protein